MKKIFKYLVLLIPIILVAGVVFLILKVFRIQTINCQSQYGNCTDSLKSEISKLKKDNIIATRSNLKSLLKNDKSVLDYSINLSLLLTYNVYVIERKPIIAFILGPSEFALVDKDGFITDKVSKTNLPKIDNSVKLSDVEVSYVASLVSELYTFYGVSGAKITPDGLEISRIDGKNVEFPLQGDKDELLGALNLIILRLPSVAEASTIGTIDLRFKNPVLR